MLIGPLTSMAARVTTESIVASWIANVGVSTRFLTSDTESAIRISELAKPF